MSWRVQISVSISLPVPNRFEDENALLSVEQFVAGNPLLRNGALDDDLPVNGTPKDDLIEEEADGGSSSVRL